MDREQEGRFREAVERKKAEAQERSEAPHAEHAGEGKVDGPQPGREDARASATRHDEVTADKWNQ